MVSPSCTCAGSGNFIEAVGEHTQCWYPGLRIYAHLKGARVNWIGTCTLLGQKHSFWLPRATLEASIVL